MNTANVLLLFFMKQLPAIFYDELEYLEYPELLGKFIGAAFSLRPNDVKVLIDNARCMFASQSSMLRKNGLKLPKFKD